MDPRGSGIDYRNTVSHVSFDYPAVHYRLDLRKLDPVVYSARIVKVADNGADLVAVFDEDADRIGKVVFLLSIICADPSQCGKQERRFENVHRRVDLLNLELFFGAVLMLNDLDDVSVCASNDPSVTGGIISLSGNENCGTVTVNSFKCVQSLCNGLCGNHRAVSGKNDRQSVSSFKERCSLHYGMSCSPLLLLKHVSDVLA